MPGEVKGRVPMPKLPEDERRGSFGEVARGYSAEDAAAEAARCLQCRNRPCTEGCPVGVPIPDFIRLIRQGDMAGAAAALKTKNNLPAVCGRVCPQESQCEAQCLRGKQGAAVAIGALERYVADWEMAHRDEEGKPAAKISPDAEKVAVVGSGPAGLAAAADLAKYGYRVTLFESLHAPGGVLRYGIPEFRLPKSILDKEIDYIRSLGVEIEVDTLIGQTLTLDDLWAQGYQGVFVATGAGLPHFLGIPGENLNGVYSANEFLTRVNLGGAYRFPDYDTPIRAGENVAVIGGGNVAMDAARTALRLGASKVSVVYRRSREEMPARREEVENAEEEGVEFLLLRNPLRLLGNEQGWVEGLEAEEMTLGEPDEKGRRKPVPVPGTVKVLPVDTVIVAVGQGPNPIFVRYTPGLATTPKGQIVVDPSGATSIPGVYAGGDIVTGAATVILAMGAGKAAAEQIDQYLLRRKQGRADGH